MVLFFHGARDTSTSWKYQVQSTEMQSKFHMIAVDYICDAGRSLPIKCPSEKGDHGKWVKDLMAYLKIENADLVGYSNGSFVSTSVGIEAPDLVKGRNIILVYYFFKRNKNMCIIRSYKNKLDDHIIVHQELPSSSSSSSKSI